MDMDKDTKGTKGTKGKFRLRPNETSYRVIGCALRVHTAVGPGGLEKPVCACLGHEMVANGLYVEEQVPLQALYKGMSLPLRYRADFVVEECLVAEVKCVPKILPVHRLQLLNYLRQANLKLGLVLNFGEAHLKDGIHRVLNGDQADL